METQRVKNACSPTLDELVMARAASSLADRDEDSTLFSKEHSSRCSMPFTQTLYHGMLPLSLKYKVCVKIKLLSLMPSWKPLVIFNSNIRYHSVIVNSNTRYQFKHSVSKFLATKNSTALNSTHSLNYKPKRLDTSNVRFCRH